MYNNYQYSSSAYAQNTQNFGNFPHFFIILVFAPFIYFIDCLYKIPIIPPYFLNLPRLVLPVPVRREIIKYENNRPDSHYAAQPDLHRKYSDNFMIHFEESESDNLDDYRGIDKPRNQSEFPVSEAYHNAAKPIAEPEEQFPGYSKDPDLKASKKIRDFPGGSADDRFDRDNVSEDGGKPDLSHREEKPIKSGAKATHEYTFQAPELSEDSLKYSRLPQEVIEAAKAYLKALKGKLGKDESKDVLHFFGILKVGLNSF